MPGTEMLATSGIPIQTMVMLTLYVVASVYAIFSAVFYYHWRTYASDTKVTTYTIALYFITTAPLLIVMGILALTI